MTFQKNTLFVSKTYLNISYRLKFPVQTYITEVEANITKH